MYCGDVLVEITKVSSTHRAAEVTRKPQALELAPNEPSIIVVPYGRPVTGKVIDIDKQGLFPFSPLRIGFSRAARMLHRRRCDNRRCMSQLRTARHRNGRLLPALQ
jgi:hypothetical protein